MKSPPHSTSTVVALLALAALSILNSRLSTACAQGTQFTYQGRLNDGGSPANGRYVFRFTILDGPSNGVSVGVPIVKSPVDVSNGLFSVNLDFGVGIFNGAGRWLGIELHTNDNLAPFVQLTPKQPVLPAPYAIYAGSVDAAGIIGVVPSAFRASYATNFAGALTGDVTGTQTSTVVLSVGGQSATNIARGVGAANAASSGNITNTIVKRDANGDFSAGTASLGGSLNLPFPATVYAGTNTLLVDHGSLFLGVNAGRGEAGAVGNVGVGDLVLSSGTAGSYNTGIGERALQYNAVGRYNTAIGFDALFANLTGDYNTGSGSFALLANTSGNFNTANGSSALAGNTEGSGNTASGMSALASNTTGSDNTAHGAIALFANTTGSNNSADGVSALRNNTEGSYNTASGAYALSANMTGTENTAGGSYALSANTTGHHNTANGADALTHNTGGIENTASGARALASNTDGSYNTASGVDALGRITTGSGNTAVGEHALFAHTIGSDNIALGSSAGGNHTSGENNIYIGNPGVAVEDATIRIGSQFTHGPTYIAGIWNVPVAVGSTVYVQSSGQLGTVPSSARFKHDIQNMGETSDVLLSLRPVMFRYKPELDPQGLRQFGLVAEEVEKVDPDLVTRDDKNQVYSVRYEAVNAMLLNAFLKQHRQVQEQNEEIQELKQRLALLERIVQGQKPNQEARP